jgi:uncharacterized coiled-coil DUF342 family protein
MNQCNEPDHGAINAERAESRGLRKAWVELDDKRQDLEKQLSTITEQRDRLAEALRELCETLLADKPRDITELLNKAGDALAAVKGGSDE